jgi:hypothetical protein
MNREFRVSQLFCGVEHHCRRGQTKAVIMRPEDSPKLNIKHSAIRYVLLRKSLAPMWWQRCG